MEEEEQAGGRPEAGRREGGACYSSRRAQSGACSGWADELLLLDLCRTPGGVTSSGTLISTWNMTDAFSQVCNQ